MCSGVKICVLRKVGRVMFEVCLIIRLSSM